MRVAALVRGRTVALEERGADSRILVWRSTQGDRGSRHYAVGQRRPLELPDLALELADPLAERGVLGVQSGDLDRALHVAGLSPAGDAAARGTDPLRRRPVSGRPQTVHSSAADGVHTVPGATSDPGAMKSPSPRLALA